MKIAILGNGRSGKAAKRLAERDGCETVVLDGDDVWPAEKIDLVVTSPGIALSHPWQKAARALKTRVISELQFGATHFNGKMLAVTGSKGKSSVVKLVADGLNETGRKAIACGNYGLPLCEVALDHADVEWAVVEVSSFQMETTDPREFRPFAATILNLQEDHIDRHGTVAIYHACKRRMLEGAERVVSPNDDFNDEIAGSYFDNFVLRSNASCGCALMAEAGMSRAEIARALADFVPLPHRMQLVHEENGVRYIDDSKATSLAALGAGVMMAAEKGAPVSLIAGGLPKGDDPNSVRNILQKWVKKVYLIGRSEKAFSESWSEVVKCEECGTMETAVRRAKREAVRGDVVLLSPGTASFDQFKSYGARGDAFAGYVKEKTK